MTLTCPNCAGDVSVPSPWNDLAAQLERGPVILCAHCKAYLRLEYDDEANDNEGSFWLEKL